MPTISENYTGTNGSRYTLNIDWSNDNINTSNNTSRVNFTVRMATSNNFGYFDNGNPGGSVTVDGQTFNFNGNYPSSGVQTFISSSKTITHESNGSRSISISAYHNADQGGGLGTSTPSGTAVLTTIDRYADITGYTRTAITDVGFTTNVTANATCDALQYSLNGGAWTSSGSGDFTSRNFTLSNLKSGTLYTIRVRVRRKDSQLWTESSTQNVTTLVQNNFFDFI